MTPRVVPVCRPALPLAAELLPYLQEIDARRHYTNRGTLVQRLEGRLGALFGRGPDVVRSASSGTAALELAILVHAGEAQADRPLALVPAFTFAATALAAERCGYRPHLVDVDPETWAVDPRSLARHPLIERAGVVLSVAPYGVLPEVRALEGLQDRTGVPVVLDAAAAFEAILEVPEAISDRVPIALSFHATKAFSTGEGGAVLWDQPEGQGRVVQAANFGFLGSRAARVRGTNAKMSEYHAAVGLAMLDGLPGRRAAWARVVALWRGLAQGRDLAGRLHLPPRLSSAYALLEADGPATMRRMEARLRSRRVETRRWYEGGLHLQPHFRRLGRDPLPVTEDLSQRLLGLPMAHDLARGDIAHVLDGLAEAAVAVRLGSR